MQELIPINIIIGDRNYRIRIEPADEASVRRTIKLVNDKVLEFKTNFAGKDMQDYVAMVLLWLATEQMNMGSAQEGQEDIRRALIKIESQLDAISL